MIMLIMFLSAMGCACLCYLLGRIVGYDKCKKEMGKPNE